MNRLLLVLTLVSSCWLFSQDRKDLCALRGRTVNALTGEALGKVRLTLRALPPGAGSRSLTSDPDGRFSFEDIEPGSYVLSAYRRGSQEELYRASDGSSLTLLAGQAYKDIEFKLTSLGGIRGAVVDEEGKPLPRVVVSAEATSGTATGIAETDAAGEFRFLDMAPDTYLLLAVPSDDLVKSIAPPSKGSKERFLATYYPSAADAAGAIPVQAPQGSELRGIRIVLRKGPLNVARYHVRGKVVALSPETSLSKVSLRLASRLQSPIGSMNDYLAYLQSVASNLPHGVLAKDGSFDLREVQPGSYYLTALRQDETQRILASAEVDVTDADVAGIVLRLREPIQVSGTIAMEGKERADLAGIRIEPSVLDGPPRNSAKGWVDPGDTFTLENVAPARYQLNIVGLPEGSYVKSIRFGGRETIDSGLDLTEVQTAPPLDILISPNGATIQGTALLDDGKPAAGASLYLIPDPARPEWSSRIRSATAGERGRFAIKSLPPGDYRLYAFERSQPVSPVNLGFLRPLESKALKLTVKEGESKQADPKILKLEQSR